MFGSSDGLARPESLQGRNTVSPVTQAGRVHTNLKTSVIAGLGEGVEESGHFISVTFTITDASNQGSERLREVIAPDLNMCSLGCCALDNTMEPLFA